MDVHEAAKSKVRRCCCAEVGNIKLTSHRLFKDEGEEFTQLGEQYIKVFEPLNSDQNYLRPYVLCTTCKLYIAKVVGGDAPIKQPIQFNWPEFLHQTRSTCTLVINAQCVKTLLDLDDVLLPNQKFHTQNQEDR